jgi:acyl transferase domain-containing protein
VRTLVICPGRGSYGPRELGTLAKLAATERGEPAVAVAVTAVDAAREELELGSIRALDEAKSFTPEHAAAENASALIFGCSVADFRLFPENTEVCGLLGNSLGFYTALALSGALTLEDGAKLVVTMARLQTRLARGAQILYPLVDEEWRPVPERQRAIAQVVESGLAFPSIHLGGFAVLACADPATVPLPKLRQGGRDYPFVLEGHHGYHSPLVSEVARAAQNELELRFAAPRVHLVDGRGAIFTPWSAAPSEIAAYALGHQVREPFDFTGSLRTALRELAPEALVLLGPGESIGGAIGQVIVESRFAGINSKESFQERQRSEKPILYALGRADQRSRFLEG